MKGYRNIVMYLGKKQRYLKKSEIGTALKPLEFHTKLYEEPDYKKKAGKKWYSSLLHL